MKVWVSASVDIYSTQATVWQRSGRREIQVNHLWSLRASHQFSPPSNVCSTERSPERRGWEVVCCARTVHPLVDAVRSADGCRIHCDASLFCIHSNRVHSSSWLDINRCSSRGLQGLHFYSIVLRSVFFRMFVHSHQKNESTFRTSQISRPPSECSDWYYRIFT